jgi:polysaccharide biosynthesis protein PelC
MNYFFNQKLRLVSSLTSIGIFLLMSAGCGHNGKTSVFSKPTIGSNSILYAPWNPTKKVCVLPFDNISKEQDVNLKVMEIFLTELFSAGIFEDIVDPIQANAALGGMRIRKPDSLDKETIKALGDRLGVQYLILGSVTDYDYGKAKDSAAQVGISVRMIDVDTGNILWTGNDYKNGDKSMGRIFGFTNGPNPSALTKVVCEDIISSLQYQIRKSSNGRSFRAQQQPQNTNKAQQQPQSTKAKVVTVDDPVDKRR